MNHGIHVNICYTLLIASIILHKMNEYGWFCDTEETPTMIILEYRHDKPRRCYFIRNRIIHTKSNEIDMDLTGIPIAKPDPIPFEDNQSVETDSTFSGETTVGSLVGKSHSRIYTESRVERITEMNKPSSFQEIGHHADSYIIDIDDIPTDTPDTSTRGWSFRQFGAGLCGMLIITFFMMSIFI